VGSSENIVKKDILRILEDLGIKAWPVQSGELPSPAQVLFLGEVQNAHGVGMIVDDITVFSRWIVDKLAEDKKLAEMLYP
jgi:hypothetical protein